MATSRIDHRSAFASEEAQIFGDRNDYVPFDLAPDRIVDRNPRVGQIFGERSPHCAAPTSISPTTETEWTSPRAEYSITPESTRT